MYDPNVIAYLSPVKGKGRKGAIFTIHMVENAALFTSARHQDGFQFEPGETHARFVREATEQPEEDDAQEDEPCLKLTFDKDAAPKQTWCCLSSKASACITLRLPSTKPTA